MNVAIEPLLDLNRGRWIQYAKRVAVSLYNKGIVMPIIVDVEGQVINGIGRLELLAERGHHTVDIITIDDPARAEFARMMLNYLSMLEFGELKQPTGAKRVETRHSEQREKAPKRLRHAPQHKRHW
jgi:hypothetical protein